MNHPTGEVEELHDLAMEAMACDDYPQAVIFLKKALGIAPLRKDLRAKLAQALAREHKAPDTAGLPASPAIEPDPLPSRPTWTPSSKSGARVNPAAQISSRGIQVHAHGNLAVPIEFEEEPMMMESELSDVYSRDNENSISEENAEPSAPATPKRSRSVRRAQATRDLEDAIASLLEMTGRTVGKITGTQVAYAASYLLTVGFIATACVYTARTFSDVIATPASSTLAQAPVADVPTSEASLAPSLSAAPPPPVTPRKLDLGPTEEEILKQGQDLVRKGNYREAVQLLEPALESGNRTVTRDKIRDTVAEAWRRRGTDEVKKGKMSDAVASYRSALKASPSVTANSLHLANALFYLGQEAKSSKEKAYLDESLKLVNDVVRVEPRNVNAFQLQAQVHQSLGRKADARAAWLKVQSLADKKSETYLQAVTQLKKLSSGA